MLSREFSGAGPLVVRAEVGEDRHKAAADPGGDSGADDDIQRRLAVLACGDVDHHVVAGQVWNHG